MLFGAVTVRRKRSLQRPSARLAHWYRGQEGEFNKPQAATEAVNIANQRARKVFKTGKDYFMTDATMVRTAKISYSTEQGIAYLQADANTREMFEVIGKAVAKRVPTRGS